MQDMYSGDGGLLLLVSGDEVDVAGFMGRTPPCPLDWSVMMWARSSRFRSRRRVMRVLSCARDVGDVGGW